MPVRVLLGVAAALLVGCRAQPTPRSDDAATDELRIIPPAEHAPYSGGRAYFAWVEEGGGRPFRGYYEDGQIHELSTAAETTWAAMRQTLATVLASFPVGREFRGIDAAGSSTRLRVDSVNAGADYGESILAVSFPTPNKSASIVFFWTDSTLPVTVVPHEPGRLTPHEDSVLTSLARSLVRTALDAHEDGDSVKRVEVAAPSVDDVRGVLTVWFRVTITWRENYGDDRASVFAIYSRATQTVTFSAFGHPEWAPWSSTDILNVRPDIYLRIGADSTVYFLGDHMGGWESLERALYEMKTGRVVMTDF